MLHNQYLLASYGAIPYDYPPFNERLHPSNCTVRGASAWDVWGKGQSAADLASPEELGIAPCRSLPCSASTTTPDQ